MVSEIYSVGVLCTQNFCIIGWVVTSVTEKVLEVIELFSLVGLSRECSVPLILCLAQKSEMRQGHTVTIRLYLEKKSTYSQPSRTI